MDCCQICCGTAANANAALCVTCSRKAELGRIIYHPDTGWSTDFDAMDQVEAMVRSLCEGKTFPSSSLSIGGGIDHWREIMWRARRAMIETQSDQRKGQSDAALRPSGPDRPDYGMLVYSPGLGWVSSIRARPLDEWHEDNGNVVWWTWEGDRWLGKPAFIGSPLGDDWPGYHTHWTEHPPFPLGPESVVTLYPDCDFEEFLMQDRPGHAPE